MTPLERAIAICGTQSDLARRVTGKPSTGHVYHWLRNGVTELVAIAIETAVKAAIQESQEAAERAANQGGAVLVEELLPDLEWIRDDEGEVVGFTKRVQPARAA